MTRPRKWQQVDEGIFVPYDRNDLLVVQAHAPHVEIGESDRRQSVKQYQNFRHRVGAGYRDPLSVAYVLDLIQRWSPGHYIRAKYVVNALNQRQDALFFEPITVGKIMAELTELGEEAYKDRPEMMPLVTTTDYRGRVWFINSLPTTYRWLWKMRQQLAKRCEDTIDREAMGLWPPRVDSAWERLDTSAEW